MYIQWLDYGWNNILFSRSWEKEKEVKTVLVNKISTKQTISNHWRQLTKEYGNC